MKAVCLLQEHLHKCITMQEWYWKRAIRSKHAALLVWFQLRVSKHDSMDFAADAEWHQVVTILTKCMWAWVLLLRDARVSRISNLFCRWQDAVICQLDQIAADATLNLTAVHHICAVIFGKIKMSAQKQHQRTRAAQFHRLHCQKKGLRRWGAQRSSSRIAYALTHLATRHYAMWHTMQALSTWLRVHVRWLHADSIHMGVRKHYHLRLLMRVLLAWRSYSRCVQSITFATKQEWTASVQTITSESIYSESPTMDMLHSPMSPQWSHYTAHQQGDAPNYPAIGQNGIGHHRQAQVPTYPSIGQNGISHVSTSYTSPNSFMMSTQRNGFIN